MRGKAGLFSRFQPFSPAILPGLTAWIDASDSSTLFNAQTGGSTPSNGGDVFRIESKVGGWSWASLGGSYRAMTRLVSHRNSLDAAQAAVSFPSKESELYGSDLGNFVTSSAYTVFAVASLTAVNASSSLISVTSGIHAFFRPTATEIVGMANGSITASVSYTPGTWAVFTQRFSGAESELSIRRNGGTPGTASVSSLNSITASAFSTRIPFLINADIGEIITCNVALSASDREAVESYLMTKWAIT